MGNSRTALNLGLLAKNENYIIHVANSFNVLHLNLARTEGTTLSAVNLCPRNPLRLRNAPFRACAAWHELDPVGAMVICRHPGLGSSCGCITSRRLSKAAVFGSRTVCGFVAGTSRAGRLRVPSHCGGKGRRVVRRARSRSVPERARGPSPSPASRNKGDNKVEDRVDNT